MADKRIKITCAAYQPGRMATVTDAETGEIISNFTGIDIHMEASGEPPTATMYIVAPALDVEVNANLRCAHCGQDLPEGAING